MNNGSNALVKRTYILFRIYIKINFNSIVSMVDRNHPNVFFSFWSDIYFTGACMFELGIYIKGEMKFQIKRASSDEILFCSILFHFISHFHNSFLGVRIKWMELCACVPVCTAFTSTERNQRIILEVEKEAHARTHTLTTENYKIKHLHFITKWILWSNQISCELWSLEKKCSNWQHRQLDIISNALLFLSLSLISFYSLSTRKKINPTICSTH